MTGVRPSRTSILARFHLRVGGRVALRLLAPRIGLVLAALAVLGPGFSSSIALLAFDPSGGPASGLLVALVCLGAARVAAPRVCSGVDGWFRHLPITGASHRRGVVLAITAGQLPVLIVLLGLALWSSPETAGAIGIAAGLPLVALGAAYAALPVRRRALTGMLGLLAAVLAGGGRGVEAGASVVVLLVADRAAGPLLRRRRARLAGSGDLAAAGTGVVRASAGAAPALALAFRVGWRALGWRALAAAAAAGLPLLAAVAFLRNNDLDLERQLLGVRLGGCLAGLLVAAALSELLSTRRPVWPWLRSLPLSGAARVGADALFIAVHLLPALAAVAWLEPRALVPVVATLAMLASIAAGAVRRSPEERVGAGVNTVLIGVTPAFAVAAAPTTAWLWGAAILPALLWGADRERRQKPTRWLEKHHLGAGDTRSGAG